MDAQARQPSSDAHVRWRASMRTPGWEPCPVFSVLALHLTVTGGC